MPPQPKVLRVAALAILSVAIALWLFLSPSEKPMPQQAANPAPTARPLRLGLNIAAGSALHAAALRFAEQVGQRSQGKLTVSVHPDQQLGNDDQTLEMARNGELDLVLTPTAKLSSAIPAMQYADLPFYFSGREELYAMLDGEPGQMLLSQLGAIDLVGLTFWENGFKQFTANVPIRSPRDFAKLRIRTMKSPLIIDQFESLGAQAIPIDFHATYKALAESAVDGQENPLVAIVGMRFHEVQKHLTLSNHAYLGYVFSASKRVFETLPPDLREVIQQTARELTVWEREETARREADFIRVIETAGVTITTLTPEERQAFTRALAPIADKFGFEVGYDLLLKTEELRLAKPKATPAPLLIGLDADLSKGGAQSGGAIFRGMQLAVEEINRRGGLLGQPVRIIGLDHGGNSQAGRQNIERLAAMPSLLAIVGGMQSAVIQAELDDIHRLKTPYLIPWATGQDLTEHGHQPNYTFRVSLNDRQVAPFLLEHALGVGERVVVLLEQSAWGRSNEAVLKPMLERYPAGRIAIEWFNVGENTLKNRIDAIARSGAASMLIVANARESLAIVRAMAQQADPLPIFAHWGLTGSNFWKNAEASLKQVDLRFVQSILVDETQSHPRLKNFINRYRERYGLDAGDVVPSPIGTIHAYDLTHLLARAVTSAKSTDRAAIRNALESLPAHSGVMRDYRPAFSAGSHEALDRPVLHLARFDAHGRIVLAE